jgi:hypothetical protein
MLRPTVSWPVCLDVKHPTWVQDQIFITINHLWICLRETPSLTSGLVFRLQLLLALVSVVILGSTPLRTHDHILLPQIGDSPNLDGQVPVFISPRKRVTQLCLQALGSRFVTSYDSQGYGGVIRTRLHSEFNSLEIKVLPPISSPWREAR